MGEGPPGALRALALVDRPDVRGLIIGSGPEEKRLRRHADELGLGDRVEFRREVPYAEMPSVYARASCLVLGSIPTWFSDEQFGMVLVEAMAAGLPVIATSTGAIPEVLAGNGQLVAAGDWIGLARAGGAPSHAHPASASRTTKALQHYSSAAAAERLASAYDRVLGQADATRCSSTTSARIVEQDFVGSQPIRSRIRVVSGIRRCMSSKPSS